MSAPIVLAVIGCAGGGTAVGCAVYLWERRRRRLQLRAMALGVRKGGVQPVDSAGEKGWVLEYAEKLSRRLLAGSTNPLSPCVRAKRAGKTRSGRGFKVRCSKAGCDKSITVSAFCEAQLRLSLACSLIGALLGVFFSSELALLLGVSGAVFGRTLPSRAVNKAVRHRTAGAELHLSEMLEVVALGLRSGLTFDRSFALYGAHFDNEFSRSCTKAYRSWSLGLCSREAALKGLASSYECDQLARIVDSMIRSLRFGSALAGILEEASSQARASYRASLEEKVAKAPVKMMLPTGTLILPAMLLLVMGPVLLELAGGF